MGAVKIAPGCGTSPFGGCFRWCRAEIPPRLRLCPGPRIPSPLDRGRRNRPANRTTVRNVVPVVSLDLQPAFAQLAYRGAGVCGFLARRKNQVSGGVTDDGSI